MGPHDERLMAGSRLCSYLVRVLAGKRQRFEPSRGAAAMKVKKRRKQVATNYVPASNAKLKSDGKIKANAKLDANEKLKSKDYEDELDRLHEELVKLQEWVKYKGLKVCIVFEGRDGAGKGGAIKAITDRVSPRVFRVVALPAPTEREKSQMYMQRYIPHFPAAGEVVIFDRSWYNRAGVERVMGFTPEEDVEKFLRIVPLVERTMVDSGIILIKYWLEVSQ